MVDFNVTPLKKLNSIYHIFKDETNYKLTDVLEIHFLELKKLYDKEVSRDENDSLVMWMEFIDGNKEVIDVLSKKNEDINYAYDLLKVISKDKEARMAYEAKMAALRDEKTRLVEAKEEGKMEGIEIGMRKGTINVAKNLISLGADMSMIIKATGLNEDEIRKIKEEIENFKH
ncbi:Rpn family recombination-promoting nuclease/putative transposase [Caloramator sp. Dgby_cultured_2]|uniref:Rpn family recombination-promoting nuclease/putative transposase n=1 Tax=Caloramator sp. Dgby_cultured_2 TaxID=3029174 RepID=UPI0031594A40